MARTLVLLPILLLAPGCFGIFGGDDKPGGDPNGNGPRIVSFGADRAEIGPGESVTLTWLTSAALGLAITDQHGQNVDVSSLDVTSGSVLVQPGQTTQYTLIASGESGTTPAQAVATVTVLLDAAAEACWRNLQVVCAKTHECTIDRTTDHDSDGTPDFFEFWGQNPTECVNRFDQGFVTDMGGLTNTIDGADCANMTPVIACADNPATPTWDSSAADLCTDAYEVQTCAAFNDPNRTQPSVCNRICI